MHRGPWFCGLYLSDVSCKWTSRRRASPLGMSDEVSLLSRERLQSTLLGEEPEGTLEHGLLCPREGQRCHPQGNLPTECPTPRKTSQVWGMGWHCCAHPPRSPVLTGEPEHLPPPAFVRRAFQSAVYLHGPSSSWWQCLRGTWEPLSQ